MQIREVITKCHKDACSYFPTIVDGNLVANLALVGAKFYKASRDDKNYFREYGQVVLANPQPPLPPPALA